MNNFSRLKNVDSGQAMIEYALIIALVSIAAITILLSLGGSIKDTFDKVTAGGGNHKVGNVVSEKGSYILHYGTLNDKGMENAKRYDMIILEPLNVTKEQVKELEDSGTTTYGYQSPLAIEPANKSKRAAIQEGDYLLDHTGAKMKSKHFNYYYGDIRSKHYRDVLFTYLEKDIIDKGFSGVYYDTIEDIEGFKQADGTKDKALGTELYTEYIDYFKELNRKYPDLSLMQNRALEFYINGSANHVDAMMYENLDYRAFENSETGPFYNKLKRSLNEAEKNSNSVILAMAYKNPEQNYQFAKNENWLYTYFDENRENINLERQDKIYYLHTQ